MIDGKAAAAKLKSYDISGRTGACLYWVWKAYDAVGANTKLTAYYALDAWNLSLGKHTDRHPPAGALVAFGVRTRDGDRAGDVAISLGGGRIVATDQPTWGKVGTCTIAEREKLTGRPYLGWADHIFDAPISLPTPTANEGDEFDMSNLARIYRAFRKNQKLGKTFKTLKLNAKGDVSVAFAGTDVIGGTLHVQIKTDKPSPTAPAAYQVRGIVATVKDGKTENHSLGVHEVIATTGNTFAHVPVPPVKLGAHERLRFQVASVDGQAGTLVHATYRGQHVK